MEFSVDRVDWPLLSGQMETLSNLRTTLTGNDSTHVGGILSLLRYLQEIAIANGVTEAEVFQREIYKAKQEAKLKAPVEDED